MPGLPEFSAVAAGIALLLEAVIWRTLVVRRRRRGMQRMLEAALADPDPFARLAAVQVAGQHGLLPVAAQLLEAVSRERDPAVLDAIAETVARNQWEPVRDPRLLELRLWAQQRIAERRAQRPQAPRPAAAEARNGAGELGANGHDSGAPTLQRSLISVSRWLRNGRTSRPDPSERS